VETSDQEDFLRSAGCNVLQGYLFSRAVPVHQLRESLQGRHQEKAA
jgi:EAL domain-containing protein (putative c-di-GMP-specific phosphodiesterase class I)